MSLTVDKAGCMYFAAAQAVALVPGPKRSRLEFVLPGRKPAWVDITQAEGHKLLDAFTSREGGQVAASGARFDIPSMENENHQPTLVTIEEGASSAFVGLMQGPVRSIVTGLQVWLEPPPGQQ